jgi:hypothetical protein
MDQEVRNLLPMERHQEDENRHFHHLEKKCVYFKDCSKLLHGQSKKTDFHITPSADVYPNHFSPHHCCFHWHQDSTFGLEYLIHLEATGVIHSKNKCRMVSGVAHK